MAWTENGLGKVMVIIRKACVQWVTARMGYGKVNTMVVSTLGSNYVLYLCNIYLT